MRDTKDLDQENMLLTEDLANIIRRCWQTDIKARPNLAQVAKELNDQIGVLFIDENASELHNSRRVNEDSYNSDDEMKSARDE